jgi:hypothetical protein
MNGVSLSDYLRTRGVRHALIGAVAVAARGHPRSTLDIDFLATDASVLRDDFWDALRSEGAIVDVRKGDFDDPLRGVVRIALPDETMVDLVVAKYGWQDQVIDRAEPLEIGGKTIPVPLTSDLVLLKLFAGGPLDVSDIRSLLEGADREEVIAAVGAHIGELPGECTKLWNAIVGE